MSHCPKCGAESTYSSHGPIMTINCKSCGKIEVEMWGPAYPSNVSATVFCPFCGSEVHRYKVGRLEDKILFCVDCMSEFILLDEVEE